MEQNCVLKFCAVSCVLVIGTRIRTNSIVYHSSFRQMSSWMGAAAVWSISKLCPNRKLKTRIFRTPVECFRWQVRWQALGTVQTHKSSPGPHCSPSFKQRSLFDIFTANGRGRPPLAPKFWHSSVKIPLINHLIHGRNRRTGRDLNILRLMHFLEERLEKEDQMRWPKLTPKYAIRDI